MEPDVNSISLLYDELADSRTICPLTENEFLPLSVVEKVITVEKILGLFRDQDLAGKNVHLVIKTCAILILLGRKTVTSDITELLSEGFADEQLPLSRRSSGDDRNVLSNCTGDRIFKTFRKWERVEVDHFLDKQWLVQAPVFDTFGGHFILDRLCALPLHKDYTQIGTTEFSNVFKCGLFSSHCQQDSQEHAELIDVAVKELGTQESFKREQGNLTKILRLNNRHLIKHIATVERGSSNYYVVFPLADGGSLCDYWERENSTPRTPELVLWSLQQMNGLAGALYSLHHELGGDEHCRHGDLKPANILLFEDNEDRSLVIADFGVSRIHGENTDLRRGGTTTAATTRSYEAPEASEFGRRNKPRARTYDIWSLGCVFLEFAIWLLYDIGAIQNFEENRKRSPGNQNSSFFQMTPAGTAEISPDVLDAINALRQDPRCQSGTSLGCLVNLISDKLLLTVAENRYNAEQLRVELQKIVQKGEEDLELLFNVTNQPRPNHKVFLQASRTWPRV